MLISMMTMAVLAAGPVAMEFDGSLKDGLKQLALAAHNIVSYFGIV
jgi:hypothetical protein